MAVSVDVAGKYVYIDAVFRDTFGSVIAAPDGATYAWSVTDGNEFVTMEGIGDGRASTVVPVAPGTATVSLTVSGGGLAAPLTGTLEVTVLAMEPDTVLAMVPMSVELNGTVYDV